MFECMYVCMYVCMNIGIHVYMHVHIPIHIHMYTHVIVLFKCMNSNTGMLEVLPEQKGDQTEDWSDSSDDGHDDEGVYFEKQNNEIQSCLYVYICVCIYTYIYMYTHIYIHIYIYI